MQRLVEHGVRAMFGNPDTTENPILEGLIDTPEIGSVKLLSRNTKLT